MRIKHLLWALWVSLIVSMVLKWRADTYVLVVLIVLPILIEILDVREEMANIQEELRHQRKFVMDRSKFIQDKVNDLSQIQQKQMVVDFAEYAKAQQDGSDGGMHDLSSARGAIAERPRRKKKKHHHRDGQSREIHVPPAPDSTDPGPMPKMNDSGVGPPRPIAEPEAPHPDTPIDNPSGTGDRA